MLCMMAAYIRAASMCSLFLKSPFPINARFLSLEKDHGRGLIGH